MAALFSVACVGIGVAVSGAGRAPSPPKSWRLVSSATAAQRDPIYLSLTGIPGEVTASPHKNWIELSSWRWAASNTVSTSKPSVGSFVVTTLLSRAAPPILSRLLLHKRIDTAVIEFVRLVGSAEQVYLRLELRNVLITGWTEASSGEVPVEQITFTFDRLRYIYTYRNLRGGILGTYTFCWQLAQRVAC